MANAPLAAGRLRQQPNRPIRITAVQAKQTLTDIQVPHGRQLDRPGRRGYLGQASVSFIQPAGLDQATQESQQAMPQLRGITEDSSGLDASLRGVDRLGVAPLIGE